MINYLKHNEIDKQKWDECILNSVNRRPYAFSWFLDVVSPGWEALETGDYDSVFPLAQNRKFGIRYIYQPFFAQQLGVFSREHLTESLVENFLLAIPSRYSFIHVHLNSMNKVDPEKYKVIPRVNHELDLISSYDTIFSSYNQNTRRNIRKALDQKLTFRRKVDPRELISLFQANYGKNESSLKYRHYEMIRSLMNHCLKNTFSITLGAYLPDDTLCAGIFLLRDRDRVIYHFAASDTKARENGAMFLLIDMFIKEHAGHPLILDFEGSSDPNVARFYKGFGAKETGFCEVIINRLQGPVNRMFYLLKKLR
jgi:hypothetical protein